MFGYRLRREKSTYCKLKRGFTLIELLIVIAIIGVLAAAILIAINPTKRIAQAHDSTRKSALGTVSHAIEAYSVTQGVYPPDPSVDSNATFSSDGGPNWIPGLSGDIKNLPQDPKQANAINSLRTLVGKFVPNFNSYAQSGPQTATITSSTNGYIMYQSNSYPNDYSASCYTYTSPNSLTVGQKLTYVPGQSVSSRAYLTFDTSSIPSNATINSASINFFLSDTPPSPSFNLMIRKFDWGNTLTCPPNGSTSGGDWGENPPNSQLVVSNNTNNLTYSGSYRTNINLTDVTGVNLGTSTLLMLSDDREENNIAPTGFFETLGVVNQSGFRPQLVIAYTIPSFSPPPPESPPPSSPPPDPHDCKNKHHIYCYIVTPERKHYELWSELENDDDLIWSKPTAICKLTPPAQTFLNYCLTGDIK